MDAEDTLNISNHESPEVSKITSSAVKVEEVDGESNSESEDKYDEPFFFFHAENLSKI